MASKSVVDRWRGWARRLRSEATIVWLAARHPRVPVTAKLVAFLTAAYAFSPIDLIPDFIPVLGLLDDVLLVPAGVWLALRLISDPLRAELRSRAARLASRPVARVGVVIVMLTWLALAFLGWRLLA